MKNDRESFTLLGGLKPAEFIKQYWHKKPLLVRSALPQIQPLLSRSALFALAQNDEVESRLIRRFASSGANNVKNNFELDRWQVKHGPISRSAIPSLKTPDWTLLVQGLDLHCDAAHELLKRFRFIPDARLDDLMLSYASPGGGVGPHTDSYDVFLIQVQGCRRWRIASPGAHQWLPDVPLKILANFKPEQEWLLQPGDMLYLPPGWAHDGVAVEGDCMTASVGFRSPSYAELTAAVLQRMAERLLDENVQQAYWNKLYQDPQQPATAHPAELPSRLLNAASQRIQKILTQEEALTRALGEWLTEPKPHVWFEGDAGQTAIWNQGLSVVLDRQTRMMYAQDWLFINGEACKINKTDLQAFHQLADERMLPASVINNLCQGSVAILKHWVASGWANTIKQG